MNLASQRVIVGWGLGREITPAEQHFSPNGYGRKYAVEDCDPNWHDAFAAFGLAPDRVEPDYKIFTGVHFLPGAHTPEHQDFAPAGFVHVRCNVMLYKPSVGGNPIIDGKTIVVEKDDLWVVLASMELHGSEPIDGTRRVIKSFGGLVPMDQVSRLLN